MVAHESASGSVSVLNIVDRQSTAFISESGTPSSLTGGGVSTRLGYSSSTATGTMSLIKMTGTPEHALSDQPDHPQDGAISRYQSLLRRLPTKRHTDILIKSFFTDIAWYYDIIDEASFTERLSWWTQLPYAVVSNGPWSLPQELRAFPALLFQILAHSVLFVPVTKSHDLCDLKHAPDMTFADLATEYSESGEAIASFLCSKDIDLVKLQAGLLRTSILKSLGSVVDAWHILGRTIREAQEIGLHLEEPIPERQPDHIPNSGSRSQDAELGMRTWLLLHLWDAHMGVVLGRPMSTKVNPESIIYFLDGQEILPQTQGRDCVPDPFSFVLLGYRVAYRYLQDIHGLERSSLSNVEQLSAVHSIHSSITRAVANLPIWARQEPDISQARFSIPWLPAARETLVTEVNFALLTLHRPFIFSAPDSRCEALRAALKVLDSQSRLFAMNEPREYLPFNLVFATFDAMVLTASIYIFFPHENRDWLESAVQCVTWGLARLDAMGTMNKLAKVAHHVLRELTVKMNVRTSSEMPSDILGHMSSGAAVPEDVLALHPPQPLHDLISLDGAELFGDVNMESLMEVPPQFMFGDDFWNMMDSVSE